ncbi:YetF domain-containing protein [Clostridium nigeriense]|uniref:YetF domain-containing protein n=1 Tax=Clostridium nigeriense TaxID=1805470 RepID=UPI003D3564EC
MFIVLLRTIFLYALVVLVIRLMGKRQIGELQPYEFVITIMISDLAALPMQDTRLPLILGVIPIVTLLFIKTLLSLLQLKSQKARQILEGEPCILIARGKIKYENLKKQQINLDELMEEIRLAGYFDLSEIEYGILENNGQMSFLTSNNNSNGSSNNSNSSSNNNSNSKPKLPIIYVLDGEFNRNSLTSSNKGDEWVINELKKHKVNSIKDVVIAMTDTNGKFIYQLHRDKEAT